MRENGLSWYHAALGVYEGKMKYIDREKGGWKYISNQQILCWSTITQITFMEIQELNPTGFCLQGSMYTIAVYSYMQLT